MIIKPYNFEELLKEQRAVNKKIVLSEGQLGGDGWMEVDRCSPVPPLDAPTDPAQRGYAAFVEQMRSGEDSFFDNPTWETGDELKNIDKIFLQGDTMRSGAGQFYMFISLIEEQKKFFGLIFHLMHLFPLDRGAWLERVLEMKNEGILSPKELNLILTLEEGGFAKTCVESIVRPEAGRSVQPLALLDLDDTPGHCLLVCIETYELE